MDFKIRSFISVTVALAAVCAARADTYGSGGVDSQLDVLSMGADIISFVEISGSFSPSVTGTGFANYANTTNGTDYFNTNSYTDVPGPSGTAYQESGEGEELWFTNNGTQDESVTLSWEGYASATAYTDIPYADGYSWDYAQAYFGTPDELYQAVSGAITYATSSGPDYESVVVTLDVSPGAQLFLVTGAYNESVSIDTPNSGAPGPAAVAPFLLGLTGALRRRRAK